MSYLPYQHNFLSHVDEIKNLLIVVAMDVEERALLKNIDFVTQILGKKTQIILKSFDLPKCKVTVTKSGIGLANASMHLAMIAEMIEVDAVVLLGVGGALDERLQVGDTVIAKQVIQHDSVASADSRTHLIAPGELTLSASPEEQVDPVMKTDEILMKWLRLCVGTTYKGQVFEGTLLSGSEFAASAKRKKELRALVDDALMVDMEAAAFAQVARRLKLPFIAAKTVADRASPDHSVSKDYVSFLTAATEHSEGLLRELLKTFS